MNETRMDGWTLIFIRELRQPPAVVWSALTDPAQLDQWAPFTADRDLGTPGAAGLTMVDGETRTPLPAEVRLAVAPELLEYTWGEDVLRWELEPAGPGTRLTLRHTLAKPEAAAMVAAGWHLCADVLAKLLDGEPVGVIRGQEAMNHGWEDLRAGYATRFHPTGVRRIIVSVSSLERSLALYRDVLGLTERWRRGEVVMLAAPGNGPEVMLHERPPTAGPAGVAVSYLVADVDAVTAQAEKAGATVVDAPADQPWGERQAVLTDPDGHIFCLVAAVRK
jgi:uncharacterized protein YndB with AHSA1/START domain/catechol 2,3-dioxygenase-like lactoylglutathione lyase family enzyme